MANQQIQAGTSGTLPIDPPAFPGQGDGYQAWEILGGDDASHVASGPPGTGGWAVGGSGNVRMVSVPAGTVAGTYFLRSDEAQVAGPDVPFDVVNHPVVPTGPPPPTGIGPFSGPPGNYPQVGWTPPDGPPPPSYTILQGPAQAGPFMPVQSVTGNSATITTGDGGTWIQIVSNGPDRSPGAPSAPYFVPASGDRNTVSSVSRGGLVRHARIRR